MLREKYFVLITAFYLCNNIFALAQSDIKRNEYEQFRQQAYLSYSDLKKDCNQQYLEFLKKSWEWYSVAPKFDYPIEKDKPPVIIGEDWRNEPIIDNELPYKDLIASPIVEPQPEPVSSISGRQGGEQAPLGQQNDRIFACFRKKITRASNPGPCLKRKSGREYRCGQ